MRKKLIVMMTYFSDENLKKKAQKRAKKLDKSESGYLQQLIINDLHP